MRQLILASTLTLCGLLAAPALAMPVAPLRDTPTNVTRAAWGCGPGFTRGPYGGCRSMGYAYGYGAPRYRLYGGYRPYGGHCWIGRWGYRHCESL